MALMNDDNSSGMPDSTVVAVYDNINDAEAAYQALTSAGFSRTAVQLSPQSGSTATHTTTGNETPGSGNSGGIAGFFENLFGVSDQPHYRDVYSESVRRGSYVLTVDVRDAQETERASDILGRFKPVDLDERTSHWKTQGWSKYDDAAPRLSQEEIERDRASYMTSRPVDTASSTTTATTGATSTTAGSVSVPAKGETTIPIIEEQLQVGKRQVSRGGVRVFQRVTERPVQESVQLREEHVHVERRPVNQPVTGADVAAFKEGSFELRETSEEAVVAKTARVVEEVVVGKEVTERTEEINDTVRKTDVEIEQLPAGSASTTGTGTAVPGKKPTQGF